MIVKAFPSLFRHRKVMMDSNVLISGLAYNSSEPVKAIRKAKDDDTVIITSVVRDECLRYANGKRSKISAKSMSNELSKISPEVVQIEVPPTRELRKVYKIRDSDDLKILYAADCTKSDILVTGDKDFFDDVKCPRDLCIIRPKQYISEIRPLYSLKKLVLRWKDE